MDAFPVSQVRLPFGMVCGSAPCALRFVIRAPFEAHGRPAKLAVIHPFLSSKWCKDSNRPVSHRQVVEAENIHH